jgi:hypothetical protein
MSNDAIVLLKNDHKEILKAFTAFEKAGENAHATKGKLVDRIIELLTVHTYIENEVMYPRVRELLRPRGRRPGVLRGAPRGRRAGDGAVRDEARRRAVHRQDHGADRERPAPHRGGGAGRFPQVREGLGRKALQEIGEGLLAAKEKAPRPPSQPSALKKTIDAVIA